MLNWRCIALAFLLLGVASCQPKAEYQPWQAPESSGWTDPAQAPEYELMSKVEEVAVLPFQDQSRDDRHNLTFDDLQLVGEQFASHLTSSSTFESITYPSQALHQLQGTDLNVLDPADLQEIGNHLGVDAIVFGEIRQYRMYYPPRLSLSMKFYLTRAQRFASFQEISAMAHSGVPLGNYNPTFFRQLWKESAFYDGSSLHVRDIVKKYTTTQHSTESYGFGADRFLRTKRDFLDLIAYDLAKSLHQGRYHHEEITTIPENTGKGR